jgi:hypothetical protein
VIVTDAPEGCGACGVAESVTVVHGQAFSSYFVDTKASALPKLVGVAPVPLASRTQIPAVYVPAVHPLVFQVNALFQL